MTVNLASKFSSKIDKRFKLKSVTEPYINKKYDWEGVSTVNIYTLPDASLGNYSRTAAANRYGTPAELQDTTQTLTVAQDKSFTTIIDRGNFVQQQMVKKANEWLRDQVDGVVTETLDTYRLTTIIAAANTDAVIEAEVDDTNAYAEFLKGTAYQSNHKVPVGKRVAWVTFDFISLLLQDGKFNLDSEKGMGQNLNGFLGRVNGTKVIGVPTDYLPAGTHYVMANGDALIAPEQVRTLNVNDHPQGIDGWLIEFRLLHDAFVLASRKNSIVVHTEED